MKAAMPDMTLAIIMVICPISCSVLPLTPMADKSLAGTPPKFMPLPPENMSPPPNPAIEGSPAPGTPALASTMNDLPDATASEALAALPLYGLACLLAGPQEGRLAAALTTPACVLVSSAPVASWVLTVVSWSAPLAT